MERIQHKNLPKRMSSQAASSLSTLPMELTYRILDHLQSYHILVSAYSVCTRWNSIIDTYQPYQVKLAPAYSRNLSSVVSFLHDYLCIFHTLDSAYTLSHSNCLGLLRCSLYEIERRANIQNRSTTR